MDNKAQICFNLGLITGKVESLIDDVPINLRNELNDLKQSLILVKDLVVEDECSLNIKVKVGGLKDGNKQ